MMFSISPPRTFNVTRFPATAKCDAALTKRATSAIWKPMPHTWPSWLRNQKLCWPRFGIRAPFAALCLPPALVMATSTNTSIWSPPPSRCGGRVARGCTNTVLEDRSSGLSFSCPVSSLSHHLCHKHLQRGGCIWRSSGATAVSSCTTFSSRTVGERPITTRMRWMFYVEVAYVGIVEEGDRPKMCSPASIRCEPCTSSGSSASMSAWR